MCGWLLNTETKRTKWHSPEIDGLDRIDRSMLLVLTVVINGSSGDSNSKIVIEIIVVVIMTVVAVAVAKFSSINIAHRYINIYIYTWILKHMSEPKKLYVDVK